MSKANDETASSTDNETPCAFSSDDERQTGRVKWFNNRAGFGFVTVLDGSKKDEDVFVHHSGIVVESEQYKYLVQGEYVSFVLRNSDNQEHPYQAGDVRGVFSGWLMCETRNANRSTRETEDDEEGENSGQSRRQQRPRRTGGGGGYHRENQNRRRGGGPREKDGGGEEWVLTRRRSNRRQNRESDD